MKTRLIDAENNIYINMDDILTIADIFIHLITLNISKSLLNKLNIINLISLLS
jgi:hypothetical protein